MTADLTRPAWTAGGRALWSGRFTDRVAGADGWSVGVEELRLGLAHAVEVVVLDMLSFPWDRAGDLLADVPVVAWVPPAWSVDDLDHLLGAQVRDWLSPYDVLVHHDPLVREALVERWGIPATSWLPAAGPAVEDCLAALGERSASRLTRVQAEAGTFTVERDDLITRHLDEYGAHQAGTLNLLLELVGPGHTVVDVGAHVGTFTLPLATRVGPQGRVLAVEGDAVNAELLRRNVADAGLADRVLVERTLVGPEGTGLTPVLEPGNTGATRFEALGVEGARPAEPLDAVVARALGDTPVDVLKLDVEGWELVALQGAARLLEARPLVVSDVSRTRPAALGPTPAELDQWFTGAGYATFPITGPRNFRGSTWALAPRSALGAWPVDHFDVVAAHRDSPWLPILEAMSRD